MRCFTTVGLVCALTVAAAQAVDVPQAREQFRLELPDVHFFEVGARITTVYGAAFGAGNSPEEVAAQFLKNHAGIFGAELADLEPHSRLEDARHTTGLMYRPETDDYKLTLVYFSQARSGIPVFGADVRLVVRNDPGFPLVLVRNALHNLGDFQVPKPVPPIRFDLVEEAALDEFPGMVNLNDPELVIWAGDEDEDVAARLAVSIVVDNAKPATPEYEKFLFVVDIATGEILHTQNQILDIDITGNTSGLASQDFRADACITEVPFALPYAQVEVVGGNSVFADVNGDFVIPHAGNSPVTVRSHVSGRWFTVRDEAAGNSHLHLDQTVTPPGPVNFLHNQANTEFTTAQVNCYLQANIVRDMALAAKPDYPEIGTQTGFRVNVNISSTCNAFYSGSAINFFRSGGGCNNTGFGDVVHHEYGHHLVAVGGSGQGAYGEGLGDVMGVLLTERSQLAIGFQNCTNGIRNANNTLQYPCSGGIHFCGQLLSGCVWSTRAELMVTEPLNFRTILRDLVVNTITVHTGSSIRPDITIDWLVFDDDDGNIGNGTPHYFEIAAGFGAHNMDAPPLELLEFRFPNGLPEMVDPAGGTTVRVEVLPNTLDPQPGSGRFFYNSGAGFVAGTMNEITPNVYDAVFPAITCPSDVAYYFSARTTTGEEMRSPANAPGEAHQALAATGVTMVFADNFETNTGWTTQNVGATSGFWERGVPVNDPNWAYDPISDSDGSGQCFVTQNQFGNTDVDNGAVRLISPVLDMSSGAFIIDYDYFLNMTNQAGTDWLIVDISSNGTAGPWTEVLRHGTSGGLSWRSHTITADDLQAAGVTLTATMSLRFTANDANPQSIVEAGVDAFMLTRIECAPAFNKGDMNCDGSINGGDIDPFFLALGDPGAYTVQFPNCDILNADMNGDGRVDSGDIDPFFVCLGGGPCP